MSKTDTPTYRDALSEMLPSIRQTSEAAADCIGLIWEKYGTRHAYLAAYAILVLKLMQDEHKRPPHRQDLSTYTFYDELKHDPGAIELYHQAAVHLLPGLVQDP